MSVTKTRFGTMPSGEEVVLFTLANPSGASCSLLSYGATWRSMTVPNRANEPVDVVLGFDTLEEYTSQEWYIGATIGRVANRIGGAQFVLNDNIYHLCPNDCGNCSHGGKVGFDKRVWRAIAQENTVLFFLESPDGEENFPGTLRVSVRYTLREDNALIIRYHAISSQDTLCNLTNHAYFNLAGQGAGNVLGQLLRIDAEAFTRIDANMLPTGEIARVAGTPLDFRAFKPIGRDIDADCERMREAQGYDHNFVLRRHGKGVELVAEAYDPIGGIALDVLTDQPGVQLFTPFNLYGIAGKSGATYGARAGFCLETQHFANATQHAHFPSIVLHAGELYSSETIYHFRKIPAV